MADGALNFLNPLQALFDHNSKSIADLKSREWQATTLTLSGIAGIYALDRGSATGISPCVLIWAIALVLGVYAVVMIRCYLNFRDFRTRLDKLVTDSFSSDLRDRFRIVDEGTIRFMACALVLAASLFVAWAIYAKSHS